jgi:hypothetical protein
MSSQRNTNRKKANAVVASRILAASKAALYNKIKDIVKEHLPHYTVSAQRKRDVCDRKWQKWEEMLKHIQMTPFSSNQDRKDAALCLAKLLIMCATDRIFMKFQVRGDKANMEHEYMIWKILNLGRDALAIAQPYPIHRRLIENLEVLIDHLVHLTVQHEELERVRRHDKKYALNKLKLHYGLANPRVHKLALNIGHRTKEQNAKILNGMLPCAKKMFEKGAQPIVPANINRPSFSEKHF